MAIFLFLSKVLKSESRRTRLHPPSELLAEEVVGHLELGEEQDEVEQLAHHEVGEVPRVVVEDRFVVLYKLLDDGFLKMRKRSPNRNFSSSW